jgi:hypothetical protein
LTGPIVDGGAGGGDGGVVRAPLWVRIVVALWVVVLIAAAATAESADDSVGGRIVVVLVALGGSAMAFRPRLVVRDGVVELRGVVTRRTFDRAEVVAVVRGGKQSVIVRRPEAEPLGILASKHHNDVFLPLVIGPRAAAAALGVPGPPPLFRR